jgi:hypothetical protein
MVELAFVCVMAACAWPPCAVSTAAGHGSGMSKSVSPGWKPHVQWHLHGGHWQAQMQPPYCAGCSPLPNRRMHGRQVWMLPRTCAGGLLLMSGRRVVTRAARVFLAWERSVAPGVRSVGILCTVVEACYGPCVFAATDYGRKRPGHSSRSPLPTEEF